MEYSDSDARRLLEHLVKYAEKFTAEIDANMTVLELADDLAASSAYDAGIEGLRDRVDAALKFDTAIAS